MKEFDIDVSGEDIFKNNYTICIASRNDVIKGFKMHSKLIKIINSKYGQEFYRYKKSRKGRSSLKIRLYSIIIYYLFKSLNIRESLYLNICKDFDGNEENIKSNLEYLLGRLLKLKIEKMNFFRLGKESNAHRYAYLMNKDARNKLNTYVKITLDDIEKFLLE